MKKKSNFEKKYPLFVKYILDEEVQKNMLNNADLLRKYDAYNESINTFLFELEKHFDAITINKIITDAILKTPDEVLLSIITAYLNSSETAKSNPEFVLFYNKTSNLGIDSVEYVEAKGLITNRNYKDIPNIAIDHKYNELKTGVESFKGVGLDSIYETLTYPQRRFVNTLLENKSFELLDIIFERFNFTLKSLLKILIEKDIDATIINPEIFNRIGAYPLMIMICLIIEADETAKIVSNIKLIIIGKRYDLLKNIISFDNVLAVGLLTIEELNSLTDTEILKNLSDESYILSKKED